MCCTDIVVGDGHWFLPVTENHNHHIAMVGLHTHLLLRWHTSTDAATMELYMYPWCTSHNSNRRLLLLIDVLKTNYF